MTIAERLTSILKRARGVPVWTWVVWAGAVVAAVGLVALLFLTSDAGPRAVIVNDTGTREHVFYCTDNPCLQGDGATDQVLEPGDAATDFWDSPDVSGRIGLATIPGERLIGCLSDPHPGQHVRHPYAVLASSLTPCPGQTQGVRPLVSMNNQ